MELHFTINIYLYRCNLTNKSIIFSLHNTQGRYNSRFPHVTKECEKNHQKVSHAHGYQPEDHGQSLLTYVQFIFVMGIAASHISQSIKKKCSIKVLSVLGMCS